MITLGADLKRGAAIPQRYYDELSAFIITLLESRTEVVLNDLIDTANQALVNSFKGDFAWYLLAVKNDLEARRVIIVRRAVGASKQQVLRLNRRR